MTKKEYIEFHDQACAKMRAITKAKNADYTGQGDDPFSNFTRVESMGICSVEQGFLTRMLDKLCRLSSFVQNGSLQVKDESVEDTLFDLANYSLLMAGYIKSKKAIKAVPPQVDFSELDEMVKALEPGSATYKVTPQTIVYSSKINS